MKMKDNFTAIPHWYWECGLSLLEVNILSRISSYQRQKLKFFEGYDHIASLGFAHYNTVRNCFLNLEKQGLIQKNGKVKRAWIWIVKEHKLLELHSNNQSKNNELDLQPELETLTPAVSYKNPKNINKNILREEEEAFAASSLLSDEDKVKMLEPELNNLDI